MDLVYSVRKVSNQPSLFRPDWLHFGPVFSISSLNTIAFTSFTELEDNSGTTFKCHIYVADLNLPWKPYKILSHTEEINCLEWDAGGNKILFGDVVGNVEIWCMKEYVLNDWKLLNSSSFPGEHFLCAAWFHNGNKVSLNFENKDSLLYLEKFTTIKFSPTLRHFGGQAKDGCILISSSGMVCSIILSSDEVFTGYESLGPSRHRIKVVDLCYAKNGDFLVVASDGLVLSPVHCYQVAIKVVHEKCNISCQSLPSFYLNSFTGSNNIDAQCSKVTHVKFVVKEAADAVVVAASNLNGSKIELWELKETSITFHKLLCHQNMESNLKTVNWQHNATASGISPITALATPFTSIHDSNPPPSYIIVSYNNGTIKCYFRESLQPVSSVNCSISKNNDEVDGVLQSNRAISDVHFSHTGSVLVAMDYSSQFLLYRLSPVVDPGNQVAPNYIVTLLEYCLVNGMDWWDVLLGVKSNIAEAVSEKLNHTFSQQPQHLQTYWLNRHLSIKSSLYRCMFNGRNKAGDCHALLMLNAISTTFKSLLRPIDLVHHDKDPAENLAATISGKTGETDIDKVLVHLENKEFIVEPQVLQSLQQLIQWVAHYTLFLLSSIPQQQQDMLQFPGCGLIHDTRALTCIQELLVIIRMWGLIKPTCLPVFTRTTGPLDVLSLMFKLISRTLLNAGSEPEESLLEECCLLSNQVQIHNLNLIMEAHGVIGFYLLNNSNSLSFDYNVEPNQTSNNDMDHIPEGVVYNNQKVDVVRHVYLGEHPGNVKSCSRCGSVSLAKVAHRAPTTRAWDQRWIKSCPCGGHWVLSQ